MLILRRLQVLGGGKIINKRVLVQWAGFSQCQYQKALIDECLASNIEYDRVFFLSGLDYPLWSNNEIVEYLTEKPSKELICGFDISACFKPTKIREKFILYHFFRDMPTRNNQFKRLFSGSARLLMRLLPFRKKPYIELSSGKRMDIYMGSSWWCITGGCLRFVRQNWTPQIESYFKTCFAPDEMLIQTIIFNSPFKDNAILYTGSYPGLVGLTPLHLIEYNGSIKVFNDADLSMIENSKKMFFRKAISGVSDKLLDIIDSRRRI